MERPENESVSTPEPRRRFIPTATVPEKVGEAMQMKMFLALQRAGVSEADARAAAEAVREDIKTHVQSATENLSPKSDAQELRSDFQQLRSEFHQFKSEIMALLERRLNDHLKWTLAAIFSSVGLVGAVLALSKAL